MTPFDYAWFQSISDDPNEPSEIPVAQRGDIAVFDTTITVMPGETLLAYRAHKDGGEGLVIVGFVGGTVH